MYWLECILVSIICELTILLHCFLDPPFASPFILAPLLLYSFSLFLSFYICCYSLQFPITGRLMSIDV